MENTNPDLIIPLRNRHGLVIASTIIDGQDRRHSELPWYLLANGYVVRVENRNGSREMVYLHREIWSLRRGDAAIVDHRDTNRLNNRRSNLRITSASGNGQNRGANRGRLLPRNVYSWRGRFLVKAKLHGHQIYIGIFGTVDEADRAASEWRAAHMPLSEDASKMAVLADV